MTVNEAYSKFKKSYSDLTILSCYEYESCFVFHAVSKDIDDDKKHMTFDSQYSVRKRDGMLSKFNPLDISDEEYDGGKKLPVEKFDTKINSLSGSNRDAAVEWLSKICN